MCKLKFRLLFEHRDAASPERVDDIHRGHSFASCMFGISHRVANH
jgi:hypothetical protein